jgi:hypothetical protein
MEHEAFHWSTHSVTEVQECGQNKPLHMRQCDLTIITFLARKRHELETRILLRSAVSWMREYEGTCGLSLARCYSSDQSNANIKRPAKDKHRDLRSFFLGVETDFLTSHKKHEGHCRKNVTNPLWCEDVSKLSSLKSLNIQNNWEVLVLASAS